MRDRADVPFHVYRYVAILRCATTQGRPTTVEVAVTPQRAA
jgi:hypothetical protein